MVDFTKPLIESGIIPKGDGDWGSRESYNMNFHKELEGVIATAFSFEKEARSLENTNDSCAKGEASF
jgi:hypothetical protein